jgi:Xaa-Pro dipeptidase
MATAELSTPTVILQESSIARRFDVDLKQSRIAKLLQDTKCDALLLLHPANFAWITSGATPKGLYAPNERPVIFLNATNRWIVASSVDSQRLFAEDIDGLGFHLKEFHWSHNRDAMLIELTLNRKVACDIPFRNCVHVGAFLDQERRCLSGYELPLYLDLGRVLAHALEATGRNVSSGDSEEDIAGQLAHRLLKHGAEATAIQIAADGRSETYRRHGFGLGQVEKTCVIQVTACKYGLFATASRTVSFGNPETSFRRDFEVATRLTTLYAASSKLGDPISQILETVRKFPFNTIAEHDWRITPPGYITGRQTAEATLTSTCLDRVQLNMPIIWQARLGRVGVCDTFIWTEDGWRIITSVENWPIRHVLVEGINWERPEILVHK